MVTQFNGIYMQVYCAPQSDDSEMDIFKKADKIFRTKTGGKFKHVGFWSAFEEHAKWKILKSFDDFAGGSKRAKTSEPSHRNSTSSVGNMW